MTRSRLSMRATAVVCSNDMTAMGVMSESYEEKIAIPDELSVIGFDNIRLSQYVLPPLSTVDMSQSELAHLAFQTPSAMYNGKFSIQRELSTC